MSNPEHPKPQSARLSEPSRLGGGRMEPLERFQAKWQPVRVKKTHQNKNQSPVLIPSKPDRLWKRRPASEPPLFRSVSQARARETSAFLTQNGSRRRGVAPSRPRSR